MFEIIKNMFRRKLRTSLTIFGIGIGIFALVVMGAMAEKIQLLVDGGVKYYQDKVVVNPAGTGFIGLPLSLEKKAEIEKIEGVEYVSPVVYTTLDKELSTVNFGPPASITAGDIDANKYESFQVRISKGRDLTNEDKGNVVVIGSDLVKKLNASIGAKIKIRDEEYEVIGIMEKTFTAPDTAVAIPFSKGQEIIHDDLPEIAKKQLTPTEIASSFTVYPKKDVNPDDLAKKIDEKVTGVKSQGPKAFEEQIVNSLKVFNQIIYGIAFISLMVGSLSIINTMTMSISERTKEIGIKKAIGAKPRVILAEYLTESGVIGFFGGIIGIALGSLMVTMVNSVMEQTGDKIFLLTPRLLWGSLAFSVILGILAGIYPAVHAVRINIVKALREE